MSGKSWNNGGSLLMFSLCTWQNHTNMQLEAVGILEMPISNRVAAHLLIRTWFRLAFFPVCAPLLPVFILWIQGTILYLAWNLMTFSGPVGMAGKPMETDHGKSNLKRIPCGLKCVQINFCWAAVTGSCDLGSGKEAAGFLWPKTAIELFAQVEPVCCWWDVCN